MADRNSGSCRVRGASLSRPRRFPNDHFGRRDEMKNGSLRMTPLLYVDEVEKSLPFWTDGLGFEKVMEVEDHNKLLFALLQKGEQELVVILYLHYLLKAQSVGPKGQTLLHFVDIQQRGHSQGTILHLISPSKVIVWESARPG